MILSVIDTRQTELSNMCDYHNATKLQKWLYITDRINIYNLHHISHNSLINNVYFFHNEEHDETTFPEWTLFGRSIVIIFKYNFKYLYNRLAGGV